jgi:hypothetical protein
VQVFPFAAADLPDALGKNIKHNRFLTTLGKFPACKNGNGADCLTLEVRFASRSNSSSTSS